MAEELLQAFIRNGREQFLDVIIDVCRIVSEASLQKRSRSKLLKILGIALNARCLLFGYLETSTNPLPCSNRCLTTLTHLTDSAVHAFGHLLHDF